MTWSTAAWKEEEVRLETGADGAVSRGGDLGEVGVVLEAERAAIDVGQSLREEEGASLGEDALKERL